jgi:oxalate decarboxylase/phosphoglucose isomerase-like protein (cupin superfamily)
MSSLGSSLVAALVGAAVLTASPAAVDARLLTSASPAVPTAELDFMTEQMQRANFEEFKVSLNEPAVENDAGSLAARFVDTDPVLATLPNDGVGQAFVTLRACAINQPHVHPRGTELAFVTKGSVFMGFLEENGGRFVGTNVGEGENFVFPQGLMHYAQNLGCEDAQFTASFPTRDPGTQTIASNFFRLPAEAQRATFGLEDADIKKVADAALANANPSRDPECARRCGIAL